MSTNSRIAIEDQSGKVRSIYSHWDGYPSCNGRILLENYKTKEKVEALIALGAISRLAEEVEIPEGVTHNFKTPAYGITVAYYRDRGDDLEISYHQDAKSFSSHDIGEYGYLFTAAGEWLFIDGHGRSGKRELVTLESVLENIEN